MTGVASGLGRNLDAIRTALDNGDEQVILPSVVGG